MTSQISSISLKNFKGFSDEVTVELRPITLLFGANSAGKSSVLHALQYVREILERNNANADRTLQGGDAVDLGGFLNLVHGRDKKSRIEIEIEMALGDTPIPELVPEAFEDWQTYDTEVWKFYETLQTIRRNVTRTGVRIIVGWNDLRDEPVVVGYEIGANGDWCVKFEATDDGRDTRMRINRENSIFLTETADYAGLLDDLDNWVNPADLEEKGGQASDAKPKERKFEELPTVMVSVWPSLFFAAKEAGMERPGDGLRAWLTGFQGALPRLDQMLSIPAPGAAGAENIYIARELTAFLSWLTVGPAVLLRNELRKLRYIGPLRRVPPRGFDVALTKSESAWSDGMAGWESLLKGSKQLLDDCSDWMGNPEKLRTGYTLERHTVQEYDMSQPVPQPTGRMRTRVNLVDRAGQRHQPQDVGVGISQVLPVVVAAQDSRAGLVSIEQPELHIHPSVQVGLGDLFIDGALNHGLSFLIETHSEHLIMRLQRRLRETAAGELPVGQAPLAAEQVNIVYLDRDDQGVVSQVTIGLEADGKFSDRWPRGFFPERMQETLPKDIRDRLKGGSTGSSK